MPVLQFKKVYIKLGDRPQMESFKDVSLTENEIKMTLSKSFTTGAVANRSGLIGILLNKLFSSMMKKEEFTFSFTTVKKIEISTSTVLGKTSHNIMFWNCDPNSATYENCDFTINISTKQIEEVKTLLARVIRKSDYKELEPNNYAV